jgi:hypothetical protein
MQAQIGADFRSGFGAMGLKLLHTRICMSRGSREFVLLSRASGGASPAAAAAG